MKKKIISCLLAAVLVFITLSGCIEETVDVKDTDGDGYPDDVDDYPSDAYRYDKRVISSTIIIKPNSIYPPSGFHEFYVDYDCKEVKIDWEIIGKYDNFTDEDLANFNNNYDLYAHSYDYLFEYENKPTPLYEEELENISKNISLHILYPIWQDSYNYSEWLNADFLIPVGLLAISQYGYWKFWFNNSYNNPYIFMNYTITFSK